VLKADVDRLRTELEKNSVRPPSTCLVIKKWVNPWEWLQRKSVATCRPDDRIDIVADIPEDS